MHPEQTALPLYGCAPQASLPDGLCEVADRASSPWSPQIARFMGKVEASSGCWLWTGYVQADGYARTVLGGVRMGVHEASYLLFVGEYGDDLELDHVRARGCTNRHCVNPGHLEPVTREEQMRRMRHPWPSAPASSKPRCANGHAYTADNTYVRTDAAKYCRTCARVGNAVRRANRRAAANTDVRPTLDALAAAVCSEIVSRGCRGRALPIDPPFHARVAQLLGMVGR